MTNEEIVAGMLKQLDEIFGNQIPANLLTWVECY